uniref:Selenoprotein m2 n=1 Tax=Tetraselmis sp. GSL018 TaxID=582737 RepID=A0A061S825_9CHLO
MYKLDSDGNELGSQVINKLTYSQLVDLVKSHGFKHKDEVAEDIEEL